MAKDLVRLPGSSDRIVICGQTGSGKSQAGVWHLSNADFDVRPWIVIDAKNDPNDLINNIEKAQDIYYDDKLPEAPGIYVLKCAPDDKEELIEFYQRVLNARGIGTMVDEGYVIGQNNRPFNTCLMQGRSLKMPMIVLTQRPVRVSPWVFSEANFWQVFNLTKKKDREIVAADVPISVDYDLPDYWSYYYDVSKRRLERFSPVPEGEILLAKIDARHPKRRRVL